MRIGPRIMKVSDEVKPILEWNWLDLEPKSKY